MDRKRPLDLGSRALEPCDAHAHGRLNRRDNLKGLGAFAVGGLTAEALLEALGPNCDWAQQVEPNDERIRTQTFSYESPPGAGTRKGLLAWPAKGEKFPFVLVVLENCGLHRSRTWPGALPWKVSSRSRPTPCRRSADTAWILTLC